MSVICRKLLLKLALRTYIFLKLSHASTLSVWTEEIQAKTGEWTKQTAIYCDTFWLQSFNTRNSSFRKCKNLCYCTVFALFHFGFENNFRVQASGGGLGGAICRFFALRVWGAYAWRGYFRDFTVYFNLMENEWIVASSKKGCKEFIIRPERKLFLTGPTREIPSGAHLARSVSQSERRVRFRGFSHIISSLHERRFMSQARRTRHFARSARPAQNTPFATLVS